MKRDVLIARCQAAAEEINHAGADVVIVVGYCLDENCIVSGSWCPDAEMMIMLLKRTLQSLETGEASIIDKRGQRPE
jgi:hypothetical protein